VKRFHRGNRQREWTYPRLVDGDFERDLDLDLDFDLDLDLERESAEREERLL